MTYKRQCIIFLEFLQSLGRLTSVRRAPFLDLYVDEYRMTTSQNTTQTSTNAKYHSRIRGIPTWVFYGIMITDILKNRQTLMLSSIFPILALIIGLINSKLIVASLLIALFTGGAASLTYLVMQCVLLDYSITSDDQRARYIDEQIKSSPLARWLHESFCK